MIEDHRISPVELRYLLGCPTMDGAYDWSASVPAEVRLSVVERMISIGLVEPGNPGSLPRALTVAGQLYVDTILSTPLPKATTRWEIPARPAVSAIKER